MKGGFKIPGWKGALVIAVVALAALWGYRKINAADGLLGGKGPAL